MDTSLSLPLTCLAILGIIIALGSLVDSYRKTGPERRVLSILGLIILSPSVFFLLVLNPWLLDPRFRAFRSFYYDIEDGMTRAQVIELLESHYPEDGLRGRPTFNQNTEKKIHFFMNTENNQHTCEGVFISFSEGHVTSRQYSCD